MVGISPGYREGYPPDIGKEKQKNEWSDMPLSYSPSSPVERGQLRGGVKYHKPSSFHFHFIRIFSILIGTIMSHAGL